MPFERHRAPGRQIRPAHKPEAPGRPEQSGPVHDAKPTRKAPKVERPPVPKPTQVGGYQHTQARERNLVKELGTLTP